MAKKSKESSRKKGRKNSDKKKKIKYETRRDFLLSAFPETVLNIWFKDDEEKRRNFGNFLISQEELNTESNINDLCVGDNIYEEKIYKLKSKKHKNMTDILITMEKVLDVSCKMDKNKKYSKMRRKKDLSLATYLDSSRYSKKLLSKSKYRKELKQLAKQEQNEIKEMRRLGYIRNKDVDKELSKLEKANKVMGEALSDAYSQKHFL